MEHLLDRRPSQLSGGQRQRVAIGRAIVRKPEVFLFDEPLSNLDAALRMDMRMEIGKLHQQLGATMIYVTHDQVEAMTLADKIVVLRAGEVMQIGAPMELYHKPANLFVAGFLGSPSMNFLDVTVQDADATHARVSQSRARPRRRARAARPLPEGRQAQARRTAPVSRPDCEPRRWPASRPRRADRTALGAETVVEVTLRDNSRVIARCRAMRSMQQGTRSG